MKAVFRLFVLVLLIGGWSAAALSLHLVRSIDVKTGQERWLVVPKSRMGVADTYVDARAWTPVDVGSHPTLVGRLIDAGKADLLAPAVPQEQRPRLVEFLRETLANPPAPSTQPTTQPR